MLLGIHGELRPPINFNFHNCVWCASTTSVNKKWEWIAIKKEETSHLKQIQYHENLTPRLIDSNIYSDVTSNVRSKKNAPNSIVAAKVEVLLKILLYTFPTIPAIFNCSRIVHTDPWHALCMRFLRTATLVLPALSPLSFVVTQNPNTNHCRLLGNSSSVLLCTCLYYWHTDWLSAVKWLTLTRLGEYHMRQ
jgi:hypothetical protein